jgi:Uma2 family endonuclease
MFGSTTFRREDWDRGFEPDSCFYIQSVERISGISKLDLAVHPPPDLVIEVDLSHSSLDRLPIYAAVGVPEVWRYNGQELIIFTLAGEAYVMQGDSVALPGVTSTYLAQWVTASKGMKRTAWLRSVRAWARSLRKEGD